MDKMPWPALRVEFSKPPQLEQWEIFCAFAQTQMDIQSIEEIGDARPPLANQTGPQSARFFMIPDLDPPGLERCAEILGALATRQLDANPVSIIKEWIPYRDWTVEWRQYFKTLRAGERVYVSPPWEGKLPADAPTDAVMILIDPGRAFGTGTHETTQLCLRMLEKFTTPGMCLLDVGAGSGILGIGSLLLGANFIIAAEYDTECEDNFHLNAGLNHVSDRMRLYIGSNPLDIARQAINDGFPSPDLIVCNMLSERFYPLLGLLHEIGSRLILSGFLLTESSSVRDAIDRARFAVEESYSLQEWGAFVLRPI